MVDQTAFLFPGQGSQYVGMGKSLYEGDEAARARFDEADAVLGRPISKICFEGPEEALKDTENLQPAQFVVSVAACDALRARGVEPACAAGHSLGEYAALYATGVFDFETGLRLVAARGRAMAGADQGAMAAIIGMDMEPLEALCAEASAEGEPVVIANDNSPGQVVISGAEAAVKRACDAANEAGAKRVVPLPVSGAFHSPLMGEAACTMAGELEGAALKAPSCPFIPNVTATPESDPEAIRRYLVEQITGRVRWVESVRAIVGMGVSQGLEVGPGKVLSGLARRIDRGFAMQAAGELKEIEKATA